MTTTTIAQRLRAVAEAERLSDHVRVSQHIFVYWRRSLAEYVDEFGAARPVLMILDYQVLGPRLGWRTEWRYRKWRKDFGWGQLSDAHKTRSACIRAGLIAIAEDIERGAR